MASHTNDGGGEEMHNVQFDVTLFNTRLIFMCNNKRGVYLYVEPSNQIVVKLENVPVALEPFVHAMFQGDHYVSVDGTIYLITPSYEDMDNRGVVYHAKVYSKPPIDRQGVD